MARVRISWRSANTWPTNLVFEKLFSKRKKSLKLKLRENSNYRRDENINFQKKFKWLLSEKCEKTPIDSMSQKQKYMQLLKLCAASLFKVLYTDTNFLPKLRKCCDEVMVDNCYKSRVALQVTAREVMNIFLKISTILGYITRFPEIVARRSGDLQIIHSSSIGLDLRGWCAAKFDQLQWNLTYLTTYGTAFKRSRY